MDVEQFPFVPPRKFDHRYWRHVVLFLLTLVTTTFFGWYTHSGPNSGPWYIAGLWYSLPMLTILGAHEFGHYWYCRVHDVNASLPYFLPAPLPLTGTLGAVIRIKEAFPTTRALFDIGVAGPIAGFVMLLPFAYWGVSMSTTMRPPPNADLIYFGEPLLFKFFSWLHFGNLPQGVDVILHPMGFAAWFGMLATAMNLLPFGQLDGGHIAYAVFGSRAKYVSMATLGATLLLTFRSFSWISMTAIMVAMAFFLGFRHPNVVDDREPLDANRQLVAVLALLIFLLCFTPVPIEMFLSK